MKAPALHYLRPLLALSLSTPLQAAPLYFDFGSAGGNQDTVPWSSANAIWTPAPGSGTPIGWVEGSSAVISRSGTGGNAPLRVDNDSIIVESITRSGSGGQISLNGTAARLITNTTGVFDIEGGVLLTNVNIGGTNGLTKTGVGQLTLSNSGNALTKTFTGDTLIQAGTLAISANNVLPVATHVTIASGATLFQASQQQTIAGISGSGTLNLSSATADTDRLTLTSITDRTFSGLITGEKAIHKLGAFSQTLSGTTANTHSGTLSVEEGTLILAKDEHTIAVGGALHLQGGTIEIHRSGQLHSDSDITLNGGTLAFSADLTTSITESINALSLEGDSILDFGDLSAGVTLSFSSSDYLNGNLTIENWSEGLDRLLFDSLPDSALLSSISFLGYLPGASAIATGSGSFELVPQSIPEPGSFVLISLGALALIARRRS